MKILHVITSLRIGGAEKLIVDFVPHLLECGHKVDVLLFDGTETFLLEKIRNSEVYVQCLSIGGYVYNPLFIMKLIPIISKYDIVHTHNTACQYFVAIANFLLLNKITLVTTEHSTSNRRRNIALFRILDCWMFRQYSAIIAISHKTAESLYGYIKNIKRNIHIVNNGINMANYQNIPLKFKGKTSFVITMVAGFRKEKDQDTLIKSMVYLPTECVLWLIGDGERRKVCEELVHKMRLDNRVFFWGVRKDIPEILYNSDVVVMSSHWEGFGLAAVEGMAAGKPVVASNVPGLAEVVKGYGLLFEKQDDHELAKLIEQLIHDEILYIDVASRCKSRALDFDIRKMGESYLEIYKSVCRLN